MHNASALRQQLETTLQDRVPVAFSPRVRVELERTACGVEAIDALLYGGLPAGVITELVGAECSGRTTMALAYVAALTRENVCAWIDVADALDPDTVAANGVDLERLLWVRCGQKRVALSAQTEAPGPAGAVSAQTSPVRSTGGGSPHPRSEGRDMPEAISAMLQAHGGLYDRQVRREKKMIGTPGAPNRSLVERATDREEQPNSDRLPPRRGENLAIAPRCAEPQYRRPASIPSRNTLLGEAADSLRGSGTSSASKPWKALDQALRAADLLLQGGGFSVIVLDLGSTPPEFAWRIPLATWFRFRAACERTRVSLLLLTQHPCARSSAELVVRLETGSLEAESKVMTSIRYCAATERNRSSESRARVIPIRKPPQSERPGTWRSEATWALRK